MLLAIIVALKASYYVYIFIINFTFLKSYMFSIVATFISINLKIKYNIN